MTLFYFLIKAAREKVFTGNLHSPGSYTLDIVFCENNPAKKIQIQVNFTVNCTISNATLYRYSEKCKDNISVIYYTTIIE